MENWYERVALMMEPNHEPFNPIEIGISRFRRFLDRGNAVVGRIV